MMTATRRSTIRRLLVALLALLGLASTAAAQCPGDPTNGNPATRAAVLTLGQAIPATAADAMQRIVVALEGQGHAAVVMDNNGPSDHKAWIDGEGWTLRSSDAKRCPALTWSPYLQAAYDGSGISSCGIPTSAHLACPAWFVAPAPTFDLHTATVHSSPADIADWPVTVQLTAITMTERGGLELTFDHTLPEAWKWPSNPANPADNFQYTVWAIVQTAGSWHTAGFVQMWQGRPMGQGALPPILSGYVNWWGDVRHLWGAMSDYIPRAGDQVGFFVSAGNARLTAGVTSVRERSSVLLLSLPPGDQGTFTGSSAPPPPNPTPAPTPTPTPTPTPAPPSAVDDPRLQALQDQITFVREQLEQLQLRVHALEARPMYVSCSAAINLGARIPISCKLTQ